MFSRFVPNSYLNYQKQNKKYFVFVFTFVFIYDNIFIDDKSSPTGHGKKGKRYDNKGIKRKN